MIQEWILYTKHMYQEGLLYVKEVDDLTTETEPEVIPVEYSTNHVHSKRFTTRDEANEVAQVSEHKVALLERKI